jgi:hypothetical protein
VELLCWFLSRSNLNLLKIRVGLTAGDATGVVFVATQLAPLRIPSISDYIDHAFG